MDWDQLRNQVSNLSLYDIKAGVRKVQNAVMNYTEMESKVREATNNEPWGASSTVMQEIANGTFNYQLLGEIMPMIYKRFTEKSAEEWRQIYKGLQLLEFLVKNGSERVIDDARSHLSLIKMLRQFHYIDQNGKDQGINIRNRSKELSDLLSDVDKIRTERKKAKATRNKYGGVEGGTGFGMGGASSSGFGGFGNETAGPTTFGGSTRGVYGDGGGFGGETHDEYDEAGRHGGADRFDEYDENDDGGAQAPATRRRAAGPTTASGGSRAAGSQRKAQPPPPKAKEQEVDLFDFGDDEPSAPAPAPSNGTSSQTAVPAADEDDFDDFQSATPAASSAVSNPPKPNYSSFSTATPSTSTQFAQPTPQAGTQQADLSNLFATKSPAPASAGSAFSPPQTSQQPTGYQPSGPNYFTSVQAAPHGSAASNVTSPQGNVGRGAPAKKATGGDAFAGLLSGAGAKSKSQGQKMSLSDMAKQKSQAGLYGANAPASTPSNSASKPAGGSGSNGLDDLLG